MSEQISSLDIADLRGWIGREECVTDIVSADLVRKFRAMLNQPDNPTTEGSIAPRLIHFCLGQPAVPPSGLGRDGHPARGGFLPPVALPRRMWAGGNLTFQREIRVGDVVRKLSRIENVTLKQGRSGPLCFVSVKHSFEVDRQPVLTEQQDIVYRGDEPGIIKPMLPAPQGQHQCPFETSTTTLFRYSALTFNGHRIHYDRRYAVEVEGYSGLVVHGPLQATALHDFATRLKGKPPANFSFRGLSPLIDDDACVLHAEETEEAVRLWSAAKGGPIAMQAEARWD